ncbi:MAG: TonB-dependent receptor [Polyangiaceae bacterium]
MSTLIVCALARSAQADDVADEADMQFNLGTERFEVHDYRGALAHYLASNRLARNRNVLFNIALCYERLRQLPEAYRYYTRSLEDETDAATIARVNAALKRIAPGVPLLRIVTEPAGARLYLDRKDLGERGTAPQIMALAPGRYRVIAELEGYELGESEPVEVQVGVERTVLLELRRIVGTIRIEGPTGAGARLDSETGPELCSTPCDVQATPGQHIVILSRAGYRTQRVPVRVEAGQVSVLRSALDAETGSLLVHADERDALVEVDGVARGSIPLVLEVPVGAHRVRVSLRGFQAIERTVVIRAGAQTRLDLALAASDLVEAASRLPENVEDAPASVSLIGSEELRAMQYPTLAEALRGTRGVYVSDDRSYTIPGVRGLSLPGSYGKHVLITIDGVPANDDWVWSSYIGFDLRTDLDDIERIEIVRGPGSVVYGTSAFAGVLNLVTRGRDVPSGVELGASAALDGLFRARARVTQHFGPRAGVWASIAAGREQGPDFFFEEYVSDGPPEVAGRARGLNGLRVTTLSGRGWYDDLSLSWSLNYQDRHLPAGQFEAIFADGRARQTDMRGFVEARFEPRLSAVTTMLTRAYVSAYSYRGYVPLRLDEGGLDTTHYDSFWLDAEQRFVITPSEKLSLSIGSEVQAHPRANTDEGTELGGRYLADRQRFIVAAIYGNADYRMLPGLKLSAGARLDYYSNFGASLNPRLALIARPYDGGNVKLLFGKAFIAPGVQESSYSYYDLLSNLDLQPENLYSAEVEWSHRLSPFVVATLAAYANYISDLIFLEALPPDADGAALTQYRNSGTPIGSLGGEAELRREWKEGWMLSGSYSLQRSVFLASSSVLDLLQLERASAFRELTNSPRHMASAKASLPIIGRSLRATTRITYEARRYDRNSRVSDPPQTRTQDAVQWDVVVSGLAERWGLRYAFGVYNVLDARVEHPVSNEFRVLAIPVTGRSLLLSLNLSL